MLINADDKADDSLRSVDVIVLSCCFVLAIGSVGFDCDRIEKERNQFRDEAEELRGNIERITKLKVGRHVTVLSLWRAFECF